MDRDTTAQLTAHLGSFITPHKRELIERALAQRTAHLTLVLEDIYQPHNASATLRTCECYGIQNIHIIENRNRYQVNPEVAMGAAKWVSLHRYREPEADNTAACVAQLRGQGYRIVATTPHEDGYTPEDLPLDRPVAILFGTEEQGLTPGALAAADATLRIPMYGFTESLNISVSVAVVFSYLVRRLRAEKSDWPLTEEDRDILRLSWYRKIVRKSAVVEEEFLRARSQFTG